jgi:ketosteroid isomerase-like protein
MGTTTTLDLDAIRRGQEEHDLEALLSTYADDAEVLVVDATNPPSRPRTLRGQGEVRTFWADVLGRGLTHTVERLFATTEEGACRVLCVYPDGTRVLCSSICDLDDGKIVREVILQAWDS